MDEISERTVIRALATLYKMKWYSSFSTSYLWCGYLISSHLCKLFVIMLTFIVRNMHFICAFRSVWRYGPFLFPSIFLRRYRLYGRTGRYIVYFSTTNAWSCFLFLPVPAFHYLCWPISCTEVPCTSLHSACCTAVSLKIFLLIT